MANAKTGNGASQPGLQYLLHIKHLGLGACLTGEIQGYPCWASTSIGDVRAGHGDRLLKAGLGRARLLHLLPCIRARIDLGQLTRLQYSLASAKTG